MVPGHHIKSKAGCPVCKQSKGEKAISDFLKENNINYEQQKRFKDCKNQKPLPFDFYLPGYNLCIEYQGEQHFNKTAFLKKDEDFKKAQKRDEIKRNWCSKPENPNLLEIRYDEDVYKVLKDLFSGEFCLTKNHRNRIIK